MPDWSKEFHLVVDAGPKHTSAMLLQIDDKNNWAPMGFYTKKLSPIEQRLSQVEREALAVIYGLKQTSYFTAHTKTLIHSDNKPFVLLKKYSDVNPKLARWKMYIDSFDHELVWTSSDAPLIEFVDFLSRPPSNKLRHRKMTRQDIEKLPIINKEGIFKPHQYDKIIEDIINKDETDMDINKPCNILHILDTIIPIHSETNHMTRENVFLDLQRSWVVKNLNNLQIGLPSRVSMVGNKPQNAEDAIIELVVRDCPYLNLDKLIDLQKSCSKLGPIYKNVAGHPDFLIHRGILLKRFDHGELHRILVSIPCCISDDLISQLHSGPKATHIGHKKLMQLIRTRYFIPDLHNRVKKITEQCGICAFYKPKIGKAGGSRPIAKTVKARHPGDIWCLDHIQIVSTPNDNNHSSLLCIVDMFSHYLIYKPMPKNITAKTVAGIILEDVISRFGVPRVILTDNGSDMDNNLIREMCNLLSIQKITIAAGSAKSNGVVEKVQGLLLNAIKCNSAQYKLRPDQFADVAVWAALAHNSTPFQNLNPPLSPAEIFLGRSISEASFFSFANASYAYRNLEDFNTKMTAAQNTISEILNNKQRYMNELYEKTNFLDKPKFSFPPGMLVALKEKTQPTLQSNIKLRPRYKGVFIVVKEFPTACLIRPFSSETILADMENEDIAVRGRGKTLPRYKIIKVDKDDLKKIKHLTFYSTPMAKKFMEHLRSPAPSLEDEYEVVEECDDHNRPGEPEDGLEYAKRQSETVLSMPVKKLSRTYLVGDKTFPFEY